MLSANHILSIPLNEPERLFKSPDQLRSIMIDLSNQWHPDISKHQDSNTVMAHITVLFSKAKEKIKAGTWEDPESVIINIPSIGKKKFNYLRKHVFELGRLYVGSKRVVIFLTKESDDARIIYSYIHNHWKWPNEKLESDTKKYLPNIVEIDNDTGEKGFLLTKDSSKLLLKDVNSYYKGKIPMPHVLWIVSRCMHLASWLEYSGLMYGGFFTENLFVDPAEHTVSLYGGWWYSHLVDHKLKIADGRLLDVVPKDLLRNLQVKPIMDRYLIRRLAGELLGDPTGYALTHSKDIPTPIEHWINMPPANKAVDDYSAWYVALEAAYGKRKFTPWNLTEKDIYGI